MANLRIISSNAARRATLSASSTAGLLAVSNLKVDKKSDVWRATGTTATVSGILPAAELASGVALWGNFSPTNTMRVRLTNEASMTNALSYPNTFTNGAWTRTSIATAAGIDGPDGANSATTLTASAAGATLTQSASVAAGQHVSSIWLRRRTGSGAISIRNAANTAWIALPVTSEWTRFANDGGTTGTTALLSLQIAASGDAVDVCFSQVEPGSVPTSYYDGTRPLGYIDSWQSYDLDTGVVLACPAPAIQLEGWTVAQSASAYAYGGGAFARTWFTPTQFIGFAIDLVDTNNLQGYIEAAQLVIGAYWSPTYNATSASDTFVDAATHYLTDAGDLMTQAAPINKQVPIELQYMPASDRATLANILRASRAYPIFLSVFPENEDLELERDYTVYGKRTGDSEVAVQMAIRYGTKLEVKSI